MRGLARWQKCDSSKTGTAKNVVVFLRAGAPLLHAPQAGGAEAADKDDPGREDLLASKSARV